MASITMMLPRFRRPGPAAAGAAAARPATATVTSVPVGRPRRPPGAPGRRGPGVPSWSESRLSESN